MVCGVNKYISKSLEKEIRKEQKILKHNKRIKGAASFVKACDVIARRLKK